jgi:ADP-ribose pyrophosphatase
MNYVQGIRKYLGHQPIILNGSCGLIFNSEGKLLLQQRNEPQKRWGLVGGLMELGESTKEVMIREIKEETGMTIEPSKLQLLDIYSGRENFATAPNGDEFYAVITAYIIRDITEVPVINDNESLDFEWYDLNDLPKEIVADHKIVIDDYKKKYTTN